MEANDAKATQVLDLLLERGEGPKPELWTVMQLASCIDKQELPCREALAWLLASTGFAKPLGEMLVYAATLGRPPVEIAHDLDRLTLLVADRGWERPSDIIGGVVDTARVSSLAELGSLRLRMHRPKDLRLAQVVAHLRICLSRETL